MRIVLYNIDSAINRRICICECELLEQFSEEKKSLDTTKMKNLGFVIEKRFMNKKNTWK